MKSQNLCTQLTYLFLLLLVLTSCEGSEPKEATATNKESTLEYKLATLDKGGFVQENDPILKRYEAVLNQLSTRHSETKDQIGDMTYQSKKLLFESGVDESILDIMEALASVNVDKEIKYSVLVTDYVVFRKKGVSKQEIINDFNKIMNTLK